MSQRKYREQKSNLPDTGDMPKKPNKNNKNHISSLHLSHYFEEVLKHIHLIYIAKTLSSVFSFPLYPA